MPKLVNLTINHTRVTVPEGTLIVDAAKEAGINIPVFCYHPKMEPVGMCRMCLVDVARPVIDRATGQPVLEADGAPKLSFGPKLETACTTPVSEGMLVVEDSPKVTAARKDILEFLLTSHPLDCPICDKGGECPLQNLTLGYGPTESRFDFADKLHHAKRVPLGELIFLDRERCIQCGRCVRFQEKIAGDPVIGFYQRGRKLEIQTQTQPGFDSIFSGNTSDICPVGALTTADFRFGARPWEMEAHPSICAQCAVGCNIVFNTKREARSEGGMAIKRVMPRQNEAVNEIWLCDKGRFGYHYLQSGERLTRPMIRQNGELVPVSWETATDTIVERLKTGRSGLTVLAGGRLANEDLFNLKRLADAEHGKTLFYTHMGGGDLTGQVGLAPGSNLATLGKGDAVLVVASDLHEEAPIWWLRLKQAAARGASLVVLNPRATRLDDFAAISQRYHYGRVMDALAALFAGEAGQVLSQAANLVIFFGSEGLGVDGSQAVAQACANLLIRTGHTGRPNNGLVGVWSEPNAQGAWELGYRPAKNLTAELAEAHVTLVAGADPAGDDPALAETLQQSEFLVVADLFMTETAKRANVVLPALPYSEREGSFTSGERRVQRFTAALPPREKAHTEAMIAARVAARLGLKIEESLPVVFEKLAAETPAFTGLSFDRLAETHPQKPLLSREDLYYSGTAYENTAGLGCTLALTGSPAEAEPVTPELPAPVENALLAVPITRLYDRSSTLVHSSSILGQRMIGAEVWLNPQDAAERGLSAGAEIEIHLKSANWPVKVVINADVPAGAALLPRSVGIPAFELAALEI
ncbi:MAG TPA: NADH-quinone oxidoreductase subunit NuoG [Anaerolineaceae bacterium]|nr:NADH-quinone oxidoreductase subunit NuoG [Anaerolineaceae bacterium]HPN50682.1 NADH-quinone oxidoreductase subunit NuoG [Anaerolineaceae bacterium]